MKADCGIAVEEHVRGTVASRLHGNMWLACENGAMTRHGAQEAVHSRAERCTGSSRPSSFDALQSR
jgi:hypothetical protein